MGIVEGCIFGDISGKVGPFIFHKHNGKTIIRAYNGKPRISGNPKQKNTELVFSIVNHLVKELSAILIYPIWEPLVKKKKRRGRDYFSQVNITRLRRSIPKIDKPYTKNNLPDPSKLLMCVGPLEHTIKTELSYDKNTGILKLSWDPRCFANGREEDKAYLIVLHWNIDYKGLRYFANKRKCGDGRFPIIRLWSNSKIWGNGINPIATRKDCSTTIPIDKHITKGTLISYLFFSQNQILPNKRKRTILSVSTSTAFFPS